MKRSDARLLHPVIQQKLRHNAVELFLSGKNPTDISKQSRSEPSSLSTIG